MEIKITVNKIRYSLEVNPQESLLSILRERLQLTGTKNVCNGRGHCGACTVVMNGKAVRSCLIKAEKLREAEIITIEGLSSQTQGGKLKLHPIQEALIRANAIQCGFCTPGIIMELYALFNNNPNPSEETIKKRLEGHLCRCTGYKPILNASLLAKELLIK
jgi:aerobic-type carbon monoxide dehydrogenase small subunit (CoxS/CutS family)